MRLNERTTKQAANYYALGRLYKIVGNLDAAASALTIAMDLDMNNSEIIKTAFEKLNSKEEETLEEIFDL